jgi:uncharacterized membrane protein YfcA
VPWQWPVGAACAFLLALLTTPAGVSGAVLLLPITEASIRRLLGLIACVVAVRYLQQATQPARNHQTAVIATG